MKRIIIITALLYATLSYAYNDTEDFWQCNNRVSGEWDFGRVPYGCDITSFLTESYANTNYSPVIFNDLESDLNAERERYMQELFSFLRDASEYYLLDRKPDATAEEISAWQHAVYAIAHQETYWSHFRKASDNNLKMIRGDSGHGHGLMQIDDRWHFSALNEGKGANLIENVIYALDIYYSEWQRAADQWCLDASTNWRDRSRSAYSAYNGGSSSICRWVNTNDAWAQNDIGFAEKYDNKLWEDYVEDTEKESSINVSCLAEGGNNCNTPADDLEWENKLLLIDNGNACIYVDEVLHCLDSERNALCLTHISDFDETQTIELSEGDIFGVTSQSYNHHEICPEVANSLHTVGNFVETIQDIDLLTDISGGKISTISANTNLQILDFEITNKETKERYYMVTSGEQTGYINGGNNTNTTTLLSTTTEIPEEQPIPVAGQTVKLLPETGINLREIPGGNLITNIPQNTEVEILSFTVKDDDNKIYYEVDYLESTGYIYAGHIFDPPTIENWVEVVEESDSNNNNSNDDSSDEEISDDDSSDENNSNEESSDDSSNNDSSDEKSSSGGSFNLLILLFLLNILLRKVKSDEFRKQGTTSGICKFWQ